MLKEKLKKLRGKIESEKMDGVDLWFYPDGQIDFQNTISGFMGSKDIIFIGPNPSQNITVYGHCPFFL